MKLIFATGNQNKAKEIAALLPEGFELLTLKDLDLHEDIPETSETLEGNAKLKTDFLVQRFGIDCFGDDTGLEISALEMRPGVYSARYAGPQRSDEDNMAKVLSELQNSDDRSARFRTVISLFINGEQYFFEGIVEGVIRTEKVGENGFGYDPIFEPEGMGKTFAEMDMKEKNQHSHRARAFAKMIDFLQNYSK